jgi:hypothetical protein
MGGGSVAKRRMFKTLLVIGVLLGAALSWSLLAQANNQARGPDIRGAGTTIVEGGTGSPSFTPLITKVAFHWRRGEGAFECLALAPSASAGEPGSGNFDTNVMYVTGEITSGRIRGQTAVLRGTATVTGVGAGANQAFTATVRRGGPGATLVLEVSGLTFKEILLEGRFRF